MPTKRTIEKYLFMIFWLAVGLEKNPILSG
jgi:hypothetical protein